MQTSYSSTQSVGLKGELASAQDVVRRARHYPKKKHIVAVSLGGTNDGTYTIRVTPPAGYLPQPYFDASFVASSSTADQIVAGLVAALNATTTVPNLRSLVFATADLPNDDVILTGLHSGVVFTVSFPSNPNTNLTQSTTQDGARSAIPFGVAMAQGSTEQEVDKPSSTTLERNIAGVLLRSPKIEAPLDGSAETIAVGDNCEILEVGEVYIMPEDDVTPASEVYVRITSDGSTEVLGALRGTPSGSTQAVTITPTANHLVYGVEYGYLGVHYTAQYAPTDATTSVADAVAGLEDALEQNKPTGVTVSAGGTTEVTITAAAGTKFDYVRNTAWNLDTEAASTTVSIGTADAECIKMTRWKWLRSGGPTSGEVAVLSVAR